MRRHSHTRIVGDERGIAAILTLLGLVVFIGMLALSIDLGLILTARTEAQRAADGASLAGAASLIYAPDDEAQARQWAKDWAEKNPVRKTPVALRDEDIDVLLAERKVRVRVLRRSDYGGPIPTIFARVFDIDAVNVDAVAAAEASDAGVSVECMFPVAVPDRWWNGDSNPEFDQPPDIYYPPGSPEWQALPQNVREQVGWHVGQEIVFKPSQGGKGAESGSGGTSTRLEPGFWDLWLPEAYNGVPPIRQRIWGCVDSDPRYVAVDPPGADCEDNPPDGPNSCMYAEKGNKQSVAREFEDLINTYNEWLDWNNPSCIDNGPCPTLESARDGFVITQGPGGPPVAESHRYRPAPMFDPRDFTKQGSGPHFKISQIVGVFVNRVDPGPPGKRNVYGVILPWTGKAGDGTSAGPASLALRLVE